MGEPLDHEQARLEWERRRRRTKMMQNIGLIVLALGVLLLAYVALTADPSAP